MSRKPLLRRVFCCGCGRIAKGSAQQIVLIFFILLLAGRAIAQPQARLRHRPHSVPLNRIMEVTLELMWTGEADIYDIPQPNLSGLAGFEIVERNLGASRKGDQNQLRFDYVLRPLKEGNYDLARMKVEYYEKGKDVPVAIPLPRTMVKVIKPEILSQRAKLAIGAGVGIAAVACAGLGIWRKRKEKQKRMKEKAQGAEQRRANLLAQLNSARAFRIEGETGKYLETLCALAESDALQRYTEKIDELHQLADDVKFGGHILSPDQLNWTENIIRNAIRKAFPKTDEETEED